MTSRYGRDLWLDEGDPNRRKEYYGERVQNGGQRPVYENGQRGQERWSSAPRSANLGRREGWSNEQNPRNTANVAERSPTPVTRFDSGHRASEVSSSTDVARGTSSATSAMRTVQRDSDVAVAPAISARLAGLVWLAMGAGLCVDGCAVTLAWRNSPIALPLFWAAVLGPFAVFVIVLAALRPSPAVRQFTVVLVGLYPAVIYRMSSPFVLGGFDEHLHERTLNDLLHGSGLFAANPLLPVGPYYPGLELFTGVVIRLTGMPVILGMSLVVFLCRLILVLAIYHGALAVTNSYRSASLAVLFYAASPEFYFFNSQFSYQTMALALGLAGLVLLHRAQVRKGREGARLVAVMATSALIATVVTHHATSWIVLAFMVVWTLAARRGHRKIIASATALMTVSEIAWTMLNVHRLSVYMGPIFAAVIQQLGVGPHLFRDAAGTALPLWERLVLLAYALLCAAAAVICGWRVLKRAIRDRNRMLGFVALLCLVYPATLAAHFEPTLAPYGDRASTFMFLPAALCCSMVIRGPKTRTHRSKRRVRRQFVGLVGVVTFAYLGGVILGSGQAWGYLPGSYLVSADSRSQDPETLAAIQWAARHLHPGSRIVADRTPADLLAAEARLWPVFRPRNGLVPAALFFKQNWGSSLTNIIRQLDIEYIYVDQRLTDSLPHDGYYISRGETAGPVQISPGALAKFGHVRGIAVVYHQGPITIYDTAALNVPDNRTGFAGSRMMSLSEPLSAGFGSLVGVVLLSIMYFRKRPKRPANTIEKAGLVGYGVVFIAVTMFSGGLLFGLRVMPRPAFTVAAAAVILLGAAFYRIRAREHSARRVRLARVAHPLVLLGTCAVAAGVVIGLHAGWLNQVSAVHQLLQATIGTRV